MEEYVQPVEQENENFEGWKKKTALFLSSQNLSLFGSSLVQYAIVWHLTLTTQSGAVLTIATLAGFLPQIVITIFAGVWADRYPRKLLIMGSDALIAISTLILALFFLFGYEHLWMIYVVMGIRSIGAGIQTPAVGALLPQIVPTEKLIRVNSLNGTLQPFIMLVSPILAGAMLSVYELEYIFFVDVITAALAVGFMLLLQVPPHQKATSEPTTGYLDDLKGGFDYIRGSAPIKMLFTVFGFAFFLMTPVIFLTPLLVARSFGEEVWRLTANEVTFFVGSILGGAIMTAWGGFQNRFRTLGMAIIVWAVLFTGLGLARDFYLYLVFMFLAGFPMPFMSATTTTLLQEIVPQDIQGRVFGLYGLIWSTIMPFGMLIFGPLSDVVSIETLLVVGSVLLVIPGMWLFLSKKLKIPTPVIDPPSEYEMQPGD